MVTRIGRKQAVHLYIEERMAAEDLTDEKVANRIGVARETVTRWRRQQHRLNPGKIAALASALDCKPWELYQPPGIVSLDAMVEGQPPEVRDTVVDVVRRLVKRA